MRDRVTQQMDCIGPIVGEYGLYCRFGIGLEEVPDCATCHEKAALARAEGEDYYRQRIIDRWLELEA